MMTSQEIFDKVCKHLVTQNKKATRPGRRMCNYRYGDLKCAVGCLIPDEVYKPSMEGPLTRLLSYEELKWMEPHYQLLSHLQGIHDTTLPFDWKRRLRECAVSFNLTQPECIKAD